MKKVKSIVISVLMVASCTLALQFGFIGSDTDYSGAYLDLDSVPEYSGSAYVVLNNNMPVFSEEDLQQEEFETYSELDKYGRCGVAYAMLGTDLLPTGERKSISEVKPTGWQTASYEDVISDTYLYNRCHLIAYSLAGENANPKNLITGTSYMNKQGMLPFELDVLDYIRDTYNHVLYRVSPIFKDDEMVARGVQMEAFSVEDNGEGICFNIYVYNVQPGIEIDYATGNSWRDTALYDDDQSVGSYVLNTSSKKFHYDGCSGIANMSEDNKKLYDGSREALIAQGYEPCGSCKP